MTYRALGGVSGAREHLRTRGVDHREQQQKMMDLIPQFYAAAWDLCRRGIIRPGVKGYMEQSTDDVSGYSFTPFGRKWLDESDQDDYVPTEPGRFAEMLAPFRDRFGSGFHERAQEGVSCYGAHAYLACCAMCGASAESILLAAATSQRSEKEVLETYKSANGRSRVEKKLFGQVKPNLKRDYDSYVGLMKYWRDESAHGTVSGITDNEAFTSLALLLRFAHFMNNNWSELVK